MARENWTSSIGFILASAGSAIGLGNIWKFPYVAGENGGGTFVLMYVLCVLVIGLPVMCSEMLIGRQMRRNVINAMGKMEQMGDQKWVRYVLSLLMVGLAAAFVSMEAWGLVIASLLGVWWFAKRGFSALGWICTAVALVILSYYAVVGGWIVQYVWLSATNALNAGAADGATAIEVSKTAGALFGSYISDPWRVLVGFLIFMGLTATVIFGGIRDGIERVSKVLMPALFVLLLVVIVRSLTLPGAWEGVEFLLKPTLAALKPNVILMALGQCFFSLSLGMAITVTYGSYLPKGQNILKAAGWVAILDTFAALLAGLAIFPAVFAVGLDPTGGPGLIFGALPATFNAMWGGPVWATCFFAMLLIAAITSSASLLECGATVFIERFRKGHKRCSRQQAVLIGFIGCTVLGLLSVFSTADWSHLEPLHKGCTWVMGQLAQGSWFDLLDNFASNWCLPFTALATAILVGWAWDPRKAAPGLLAVGDEGRFPTWVLNAWAFFIRWLAPIGILIVFLNLAGFIKF